MSTLDELNLSGKTVLLRTDFDVPLRAGEIVDDYRILSALPTIEFLLKKNASIVILSHLGRPEGNFFPEFSLEPVVRKLLELLPRTQISFTDEVISPEVRKKVSRLRPRQIFVLGNMRFLHEEENDSEYFAAEIANFGDLYINDAFATAHRYNASVHAICQYIPSYPGLTLEAEIHHLQKLLSEDVARPYVAVIGGAKAETKIPTMKHLLTKVDSMLVGGAIANTFLRASGESIGQSACDANQLSFADILLERNLDKIILPRDTVKEGDENGSLFRILDIGQGTIDKYSTLIAGAKTIFWNGDMGVAERHEYSHGTRSIAEAIAGSDAYSVVAGGDTITAIRNWRMGQSFDYISTGGGATMSYLAGETLPALKALGLQ